MGASGSIHPSGVIRCSGRSGSSRKSGMDRLLVLAWSRAYGHRFALTQLLTKFWQVFKHPQDLVERHVMSLVDMEHGLTHRALQCVGSVRRIVRKDELLATLT